MTLRVVFACLLAIAGTLLSACTRLDEMQDRATIKAEVQRALAAHEFATLEDMAEGFRTTKARTSSGLWKLSVFYWGVDEYFDNHRKDAEFWKAAEQITIEWGERYPDSPTAHLVAAEFLVNRAWSYRGTNYAYTVEPQNWPPFLDHIERARSYLEAHRATAEVDPYWFDIMSEIAVLQNWPEDRFLAMQADAYAKEPAYYQRYFTAMDYYTPKWGGSAEQIETFVRQSLERTRESEGWGMYARMYWYASQTQYHDDLFAESLVNWDDMKKGMDDVLARYPDDWNLGNFARFACLAGDGAKTRELLDRLSREAAERAWDRQEDFERCRDLASRAAANPG